METAKFVFVFVLITALTLCLVDAWRSKSSESSGITIGERGPKRIGGDKEKHRTQDHHQKPKETTEEEVDDQTQHFNIGLIVPHTNFGKREYQRAIGSAVATLQKMRDTKLQFLRDYEFTAKNVHFDMILLTPSPTSELNS